MTSAARWAPAAPTSRWSGPAIGVRTFAGPPGGRAKRPVLMRPIGDGADSKKPAGEGGLRCWNGDFRSTGVADLRHTRGAWLAAVSGLRLHHSRLRAIFLPALDAGVVSGSRISMR